jgi:uncharacterized protein YbbK (DUF523 family)
VELEAGGIPGASGRGAAPRALRIGVSACLLGQEVRFDGGHKRDSFLVDTLGKHVEWVPVCPEVELGLGTPRETLQLVRDGVRTRMITTRTGIDHTDAMNAWARRRVEELARDDLDGYVLKKDSPSCGMERVKIFRLKAEATGLAKESRDLAKESCGFRLQAEEVPSHDGRGLFAAALIDRWPLLPVEEEGRLRDLRRREMFIERVLAYHLLKSQFTGPWSHGRTHA